MPVDSFSGVERLSSKSRAGSWAQGLVLSSWSESHPTYWNSHRRSWIPYHRGRGRRSRYIPDRGGTASHFCFGRGTRDKPLIRWPLRHRNLWNQETGSAARRKVQFAVDILGSSLGAVKQPAKRGAPLTRAFFERDPLACARDLLGCELVWRNTSGIIVETEAYAEYGDQACHAFLRPSVRTFISERPAGSTYIYLNYGVHWLLNFLVKGESFPGFVLIRALEPRAGIKSMFKHRTAPQLKNPSSPPAKLTPAMVT